MAVSTSPIFGRLGVGCDKFSGQKLKMAPRDAWGRVPPSDRFCVYSRGASLECGDLSPLSFSASRFTHTGHEIRQVMSAAASRVNLRLSSGAGQDKGKRRQVAALQRATGTTKWLCPEKLSHPLRSLSATPEPVDHGTDNNQQWSLASRPTRRSPPLAGRKLPAVPYDDELMPVGRSKPAT